MTSPPAPEADKDLLAACRKALPGVEWDPSAGIWGFVGPLEINACRSWRGDMFCIVWPCGDQMPLADLPDYVRDEIRAMRLALGDKP